MTFTKPKLVCNKCNQSTSYCDCIPQKYREQIANEIEDYRVDRCRCEQTLEKDCDALIKAVDIVRGQK
jgi:hypothetical protein